MSPSEDRANSSEEYGWQSIVSKKRTSKPPPLPPFRSTAAFHPSHPPHPSILSQSSGRPLNQNDAAFSRHDTTLIRNDMAISGRGQAGAQKGPSHPPHTFYPPPPSQGERAHLARAKDPRNPVNPATLPARVASHPSFTAPRAPTDTVAARAVRSAVAPAHMTVASAAVPAQMTSRATVSSPSKRPAAKAADVFDLMMFMKAPSGNSRAPLDTAKRTFEYRSRVDVNEECRARRFIATKRKKKFTKIKKRILMERLRNHMKKQAALAATIAATTAKDSATDLTAGTDIEGGGSLPGGVPAPSVSSTTLVLLQFVTADEILDPSEQEEVVSNIRELFSPFGLLRSIEINLLRAVEARDPESNESSAEREQEDEEEDECVVLVTFNDSNAAQAAVTAINGTVFGGQAIIAVLRYTDENAGGETGNPQNFPISSSQERDERGIDQPRVDDQDIEVLDEAEEEEGYELYLENSVFPEDIVEEEEAEEVLADLCSLCEVFGLISAVWVERGRVDCSTLIDDSAVDGNVSDEVVLTDGSSSYDSVSTPSLSLGPWVMVEYECTRDAVMSARALHGLHVGGEVIQACLYSYSAYLAAIFDDRFNVLDDGGDLTLCDGSDGDKREGGAVIAVKNYLSADDLEECEGDIEQLGAMKRDLLALASPDKAHMAGEEEGARQEVFVRRVVIVTDSNLERGREKEFAAEEPALLFACVRFLSLSAASNAMLSLDGAVMGGAPLKASVRRFRPCLNSSKGDSGSGGGSVSGRVEIVAVKKIPKATRVVPQVVSSSAEHGAADGSNGVAAAPEEASFGSKQRKERAHPPVSLYKEAVLVPKLEKSSWSRRPIKVASEEVDGTVKELLGAIATFQQKIREKDPLKAAAKRRFVMGTKQSTNCVRSGLVKLLLLAPDSESSEALDGLLDTLLEEAERLEVPVLYCLNRRKLGKALKSSMKQVVVAVLDADGAYGWFKKIVAYIRLPVPEGEAKTAVVADK